MARLARGLGSLAFLLFGLAAVPLALAFLGGNPLPHELTLDAIRQALLAPVEGKVLVGLITIIGWLAWLVFALSVISELVSLASRQRIRIRLPGLEGPQRFAAGLLISVMTMISIPQAVQADRYPDSTVVTSRVPLEPVALIIQSTEELPPSAPEAPRAPAAEEDVHHHVVKAGDDLWSLAEHYYGDGRDWRKIAAANPTVLTGGPDRLQLGWRLRIPDFEADDDHVSERMITVRRGDTLSSIAECELGGASRWTDIFRANRAQLSDPDELAVGMRLALPKEKKSEVADSTKSHDQPLKADAEREQTSRPSVEPSASTSSTPASSPSPPAAPPSQAPSAEEVPPSTAPEIDVLAVSLLGVGGLLAAGLIGGLGWRRRLQLQTRPQGRRIVHPPPSAQAVEVSLGQRQRPLSLRTLDRAMRAIAAHCKDVRIAPPPLQLAFISDSEIELRLEQACSNAPVGFTVRGRSWFLDQLDVDYLKSVPGANEAARPWPALVTLGRDDQDRLVLGDLEAFGLLELKVGSAADVLAAMAVELSFSPWADEMIITLVGGGERLPEALGKHNVIRTEDCDTLLDRLEQRAINQREHRRYEVLSQHRIDPDLADPWAPEIVLVEQEVTAAQHDRLSVLINSEPKVSLAVVVAGAVPGSTWSLGGDGTAAERQAVLEPAGIALSPQLLKPAELTAVVDLIETTGSEETTPAPWWTDVDVQPEPPPDNVTYLDSRLTTWGTANTAERALIMEAAMEEDRRVHHPTLQLLGPIELLGATGTLPPRAAKQCLEYCAWILENPGRTAQAMGAALAVAEGTRRSNMSRLRSWLGTSPDGEAYLPDAYTGRISLHPAVSSDWQRLQILTSTGVNRAADESLQAALELVRGAPLADAAPGQWHWAEELRTDMISCVRDIGVELADRALVVGDVDQARWAASRALAAAPGDELLLAARIRTEHAAGNRPETERLALQLAAQARTLGVDLDLETVSLLQRVMEGQVRARLA
jgi:hypothetical protein